MKSLSLKIAAAALVMNVTAAMAAEPPPAFTQCKACHKTEAGGKSIGPSLFGIYGRKAASGDGFAYSDALKAANITWDDANLTKWLTDSKAFIPGAKMAFPGVKKPEDITIVIEFLKTLK